MLVQQLLCIWNHGRSFKQILPVLPITNLKMFMDLLGYVGLDGDESDWDPNPSKITIPKQVSKLGKLSSFDFPNSTSSNSQFVQNIPKIQKK